MVQRAGAHLKGTLMTTPDESRRARIRAQAFIEVLANGRVFRLPSDVRDEAQRLLRHLELCEVDEYEQRDMWRRVYQDGLDARRRVYG